MHSYPWVLVAADSVKQARSRCDSWIEEHLRDGPFDYGGSVGEDDDGLDYKVVIPSNDPKFMKALKGAVEAEHAAFKEQWDSVKQFVLKFAACPSPPSDDCKVTIERVIAQGISGIVESGTKSSHEQSAYLCFYSFHLLYELHNHIRGGRSSMGTSYAVVFDTAEIDVDSILDGTQEDLKGLYLVRADCHH